MIFRLFKLFISVIVSLNFFIICSYLCVVLSVYYMYYSSVVLIVCVLDFFFLFLFLMYLGFLSPSFSSFCTSPFHSAPCPSCYSSPHLPLLAPFPAACNHLSLTPPVLCHFHSLCNIQLFPLHSINFPCSPLHLVRHHKLFVKFFITTAFSSLCGLHFGPPLILQRDIYVTKEFLPSLICLYITH